MAKNWKIKKPWRAKEAEKKTENEKMEERREEILARGRKFKYPIQYSKHKLVINTLIITILAAVLMVGIGWLALFKLQNTSDLLYRLTKVLPIAVAEVDGEKVRYSDYLLIYRSSIVPIEQQASQLGEKKDIEAMRKHYKKAALEDAEEFTYALKLGKELGVEVTKQEVDQALEDQRKAGGVKRSLESFKKILKDNFGLSEKEYRRLVYLSLLKKEVAKKIDKKATEITKTAEEEIQKEAGDLKKVSEKLGKKVMYLTTGGMVSQMNIDGGRASAATKLKKGEVGKSFVSANGDSYFIVKLLDKNKTEVSYESLQIPMTEFETRMKKIQASGKIKEYIAKE